MKARAARYLSYSVPGILAVALSACATLIPRDTITPAAQATAVIPGLAHVRFWGDENPPTPEEVIAQRMPSLKRPPQSRTLQDGRPLIHYLAISGGGSDGAYGAGLLVGWTKAGTRPTFEFVTGISAGALIAPFAYLGSAYDRQLEEIWTQYGDDNLIIKQPLAGLLGGVALADTQPLAELIAKYVDRRMLNAVAREYRKGRLLLIGTTNIDAQRPVVWNMGEIALSSDPRALQLFRDVLRASASIPGAMTPVKIGVEAHGQAHDEIHVDGGVTRQLFLTPSALNLKHFDKYYPKPPVRRIYVIRNGRVVPKFKLAEPTAVALTAQSLSLLINSHASGDIYRIYTAAQRDGAEFRLAANPDALQPATQDVFDREYMQQLFDAAKTQASRGYPWLRTIPELKIGIQPVY